MQEKEREEIKAKQTLILSSPLVVSFNKKSKSSTSDGKIRGTEGLSGSDETESFAIPIMFHKKKAHKRGTIMGVLGNMKEGNLSKSKQEEEDDFSTYENSPRRNYDNPFESSATTSYGSLKITPKSDMPEEAEYKSSPLKTYKNEYMTTPSSSPYAASKSAFKVSAEQLMKVMSEKSYSGPSVKYLRESMNEESEWKLEESCEEIGKVEFVDEVRGECEEEKVRISFSLHLFRKYCSRQLQWTDG